MHPAKTDFLYFVANPDGTTRFARTLNEHSANVAAYRAAIAAPPPVTPGTPIAGSPPAATPEMPPPASPKITPRHAPAHHATPGKRVASRR
jgi:hypothetical protein